MERHLAQGRGLQRRLSRRSRRRASLFRSDDGRKWTAAVDDLFPNGGYPNESSLAFAPDDTCYCLLRRDGDDAHGQIGIAKPPYTDWTWRDLKVQIGGPKLIRLDDGRLIAALRYAGRTSLCEVDAENGKITELLQLRPQAIPAIRAWYCTTDCCGSATTGARASSRQRSIWPKCGFPDDIFPGTVGPMCSGARMMAVGTMPRRAAGNASKNEFVGWPSRACLALAVWLLATTGPTAPPEATGGAGTRPHFSSSRDDGRFVSTGGMTHRLLKRDRPKLAFDPESSAEDFAAWQTTVREKLRELMHFPKVEPQPPPRQLWVQQRDGYELQKWEAYPEPDSVVPFLVLVPAGASAAAPLPAVLCLPGSGFSKELLAGEAELPGGVNQVRSPHDQMALWYVKAGLVAVAMDNPGVGELSDGLSGIDQFAQYLMWLGRSYESLAVFQKLPVLAWLKRQEYVDSRRIAVSGHSLGAKHALHLAILDPEIAAVVWNDAVGSWRTAGGGDESERPVRQPTILAGHARVVRLSRPAGGNRPASVGDLRRRANAQTGQAEASVRHYPGGRPHPNRLLSQVCAAPESRQLDDQEIPEGLTNDEYLPYVNVDPPGHWFKDDVAVPGSNACCKSIRPRRFFVRLGASPGGASTRHDFLHWSNSRNATAKMTRGMIRSAGPLLFGRGGGSRCTAAIAVGTAGPTARLNLKFRQLLVVHDRHGSRTGSSSDDGAGLAGCMWLTGWKWLGCLQ